MVILPMNRALRVAEDLGMLDLMSYGRVDLGVGRGYPPLEFERYGIDQTTTRELFDECLPVIRQAWTQGNVNFHGRFYDFTDVPVRPCPLQKPHPPIWMAALSPNTDRRPNRGVKEGAPPIPSSEIYTTFPIT